MFQVLCHGRAPISSTPPCPALLSLLPPPGPWLTEFTDLREQLNRSHEWDTEKLRGLVMDMLGRIEATGRSEWGWRAAGWAVCWRLFIRRFEIGWCEERLKQ